jgi:hypothetical protein
MSCLDPHIKLQLMLNEIRQIRRLLSDDSIRPTQRNRLLDDLAVLNQDVKQMVIELNKLIVN